MDKKKNDFIVFCLENFKSINNLNGTEVYNVFKKYKLFDYLSDGYDVLHTQGQDYIMNDIKEYLKERNYESY